MFITKKDLPKIAKDIIAKIKKGDKAIVITLEGDLGAGKTTLTQEIARNLGIKENLISPTFVIMKNYEIKGTHSQLVHIDAYRLNSHQEILTLGWNEIISNPNNIVIVEWPEMIKEVIPEDVLDIYLEHVSEEERKISFGK